MGSKIDKLRNFFFYIFFFLVITMIFTPLIVQGGISIFSEEILESVLLLVQVSIAWQIFRLYEKSVDHREKELQKLEKEYQKREKELLEAFAYLGKVNVQVSLIKTFLKKLKAPSDQKEAEGYIQEILKIALSLSGKRWVTLRAIDMKNLKTQKEYWSFVAGEKQDAKAKGIKIGNKDIVKWDSEKPSAEKKDFHVFGSAGSGPMERKVFLIFQNGSSLEPDIADFLRAVVNQCEVLFTLLDNAG
ncbi:MAG: hypothetical protein PHF35_01210 [Candidatus Moranbacteria bacterium]|nr:hypothetical protein [Candidatus Moranbacteria bacterium]